MRPIHIAPYLSWLFLLSGVGLTSCHLPHETMAEVNLLIFTPTSFSTDSEMKSLPTAGPSLPSSGLETLMPASQGEHTPVVKESEAMGKKGETQSWHDFAKSSGECVDQASPGHPIDVNYPDNTAVVPGQEFTKIWRLVNSGTCTWTPAYQVFWLWGEKMGAADAYPLPHSVAPGEEVDISISFIAPQTPGVYQSNWKLRNPQGKVFGIGSGDGVYFYVRVIVENDQKADGLPRQSPSPEETFVTPTPFAGGSTRLLPGDRIDLDINLLNPSQGADVILSLGKPYLLVPFENVYLSIYGKKEPTQSECLASEPSKTAIDVARLETGTYLCYLTDQGRSGWMKITHFWTFQSRALLNIIIYTFPLP